MLLHKVARKILPKWILEELKLTNLREYSVESYSQEGEDMILRRIFEHKRKGFYVDVGAHHPKRFSNTYYFYKQGWRGINIDATPGSMQSFKKVRPADLNIEAAISRGRNILTFYMFDEPALNGFSKQLSEQRNANTQACRIIKKIDIETVTLSQSLDKHLPKGQLIDFMSIDVEGLDYDVLQSNDWSRFRPEIILVEIPDSSLEDLLSHEITKFLHLQGYVITSKSMYTVFFALEASR